MQVTVFELPSLLKNFQTILCVEHLLGGIAFLDGLVPFLIGLKKFSIFILILKTTSFQQFRLCYKRLLQN